MKNSKMKKSVRIALAAVALAGALILGCSTVKADNAATWQQQTNGAWCLVDAGGNKLTGWQQMNGAWYHFDGNGIMQTGWYNDGTHTFYLKADGVMAVGWQLIDGKWYYFDDPSGYMHTNWLAYGGNWYLMNWKVREDGVPIGAMLTGWQQTDDGSWYYMHSDGKMATGWQLIAGEWYYMDPSGHWLGKDTAVDGTIFGVDVSKYQGNIDWAALRNTGVDFAFVRIGHGSRTLDTYYKQNMQGANAAGIATGVYFYSTAQSVGQAVLDAQFVIDNLRGYNVSYPVAIDLEDKSQSNLTKWQITEIAIAFCDEIRAAGYTPMIYCNENWYRNRIDFSQLSNVERWIARYNYEPASDIPRDVWQAGSTTVLPGISGVGRIDVDFSYKNYRGIIPPRTAADPSYTKRTGTWIADAYGWWYSYFTGGYPVNQWEYIGGKWYYFNAYGYMVPGGWNYINGKWYYMDRNGAMVTGWIYDNGAWYYMNADGAMAIGWVWDGANWYYMSGSGAMVSGGWHWINGAWYYMYGSGAMATGWVWDGGNWYYMYGSGAMATGWVWDGANWYYMYGNGAMATGWQLVNGTWYYMYGSGAMASNTWIGNYHVNASGAWDR